MPNPPDPSALTDGQVIAVAKMLEAVPRVFSPTEFEIVDEFLKKRDRLVADIIERVKARNTCGLHNAWTGTACELPRNHEGPHESLTGELVAAPSGAWTSGTVTDTPARTLARHVVAWSKHGPGGTGAIGPCDAHCLKCRAEAVLFGVKLEAQH